MPTQKKLISITAVGAVFAVLAGCQTGPSPIAQAPASQAGATENFVVDVDPLHGAAFEVPDRQLDALNTASGILVDIEFPSVSYDAASGNTSVTMQITNAGSALNFLKCQVAGTATLSSPLYPFNTTITAPGASQLVNLVFHNPGGGGFNVNLAFTGIAAGQTATLPGSASGTVPLTTGSSGAPTPAPTVAPTTAPTPVPTSGTGGATATASSSYGTLTPNQALDGDLATEWANDGFEAAEATLTVDTHSVQTLGSVSLKARPFGGGAYYQIETSTDGSTFVPVTGQLRNTTWNMETKALPVGTQGRYIRVHFFNDAASPEVRFVVFEMQWSGSGATGSPAPTPAPSNSPTATPTPSPSSAPTSGPTGSLSENFQSYALGADPSSFVDVENDGFAFSWLVDAPWQIVNYQGSLQYEHNNLLNTAVLSFRRYRGTALGSANGLLPAKYAASVDVTPIKSYTYNPTGDQGTQFYYLNPTHYVELQIKPTFFEVWVCNGGQPFSSAGWTRASYFSTNNTGGQKHTQSAVVDTNAHTIKVSFDGGVYADTVSNSLIANQDHWFSLRGTGNVVCFDNLTIQPQ